MYFFFIIKKQDQSLSALFFELDESLSLDFGQFYDPLNNDMQTYLNQKAQQKLTSEQILTVQIEKELKFYLVKILKQNTLQKDLVLSNPLGLEFFDLIESKILGQNSQENEFKNNYAQLFDTASNNSPDLLVKDIYGPNSSVIGLPQNLLASSFGKLAQHKAQSFDKKQILRSLIMSIAINTAQISALLSRKHGINDIVITKNRLNSLAFNRYFVTILKYNNPKARLFIKAYSQKL